MLVNAAGSPKTLVLLPEGVEKTVNRGELISWWPNMPRPRQRACLEHGLKLDLNKLARKGSIRRGARSGPYSIRWSWTHTGDESASGLITANMEGEYEGWLRLQIGKFDQTIILVPRPRHFGGHQWLLPGDERRCSVLWRPPAPTTSAVVRLGDGKSLTPLNLRTQTIAPTSVKPKLNHA